VLSLTTLGTPHRGCSFADWAVRRLVPLVAPVFSHWQVPVQGFFDVTRKAMARFNEEIKDHPRVRYFSVAGRWQWNWSNPNWLLSYPVVYREEGENDGLVSIESARWGESLEVWSGDHMNLANWPEPFVSCSEDRLHNYAALLSRLPEG
jgi:triacylglycerol lipase